jgi:hypothetical protein
MGAKKSSWFNFGRKKQPDPAVGEAAGLRSEGASSSERSPLFSGGRSDAPAAGAEGRQGMLSSLIRNK